MSSPTSAPAAPTPQPQVKAHRPGLVLGIVLTAVFVQLLDISIVNVALPSIQGDLSASFSAVQLVLSGYQLAFACTLITAARLGDIYGRKRLFISGMVVFTLASLLCGVAANDVTLVLSRVLQGFGSGLMFPQVLAVIQVTYAPQDRAKPFGVLGATIGLATILGPLVGGLLIRLDLFGTDWRMIFLVNLPVGVAAVLLALRELPESTAPDAPRLDLPGVALVTTGLFLLVYPLTEGRTRGWPLWIYAMLAASVPVLAAFVVLQRRKTREQRDPLLLMTLFKNASFRGGVVLSAVFFLGLPPFFFTFSLYLQVGLGFTPLHSGLTSFPFAVGSGIASARSHLLVAKLGRNVLALGAGFMALGMALLIVDLQVSGTDLHSWQVAPVLLLAGVGLGLFIAPITNIVLAGIQGREAGSASGVISTVQQVGGALGVAIVGVILFSIVSAGAPSSARDTAAGLPAKLTAAGVPSEQTGAITASFRDCYTRRAQSTDPTQTPAGCAPQPGPAAPVLAAAGASANADNWLSAITRTLLFEVLVFAAAVAVVPLLPKTGGPVGGGAAAAAAH